MSGLRKFRTLGEHVKARGVHPLRTAGSDFVAAGDIVCIPNELPESYVDEVETAVPGI
jgi:hypothetical protein